MPEVGKADNAEDASPSKVARTELVKQSSGRVGQDKMITGGLATLARLA